MSRNIDLTQPLSDTDREYLLARGREQQVFQNDAQFSDDPGARQAGLYIPGTAVDRAEGVPATPNADPMVVMGGGDTAPDEDEGLEDDDEADEDDEGGEEGDEEADGDNYETWTHDALQEEIRSRNEDLDDDEQIKVSGTKAELIARLREDDEASE